MNLQVALDDFDKNKLSKEDFLAVYNKHLPNKWIKLAYKYFSTSTIEEDKLPKRVFFTSLLLLFLFGFIGTIIGMNEIFIGISILMMTVIMVPMAIFRFGAFIMNRLRIRKIRKILNIEKAEYDYYALIYIIYSE